MLDFVEKIAQADALTLDNLLTAIQKRHDILFPERDLIIISLQKDLDLTKQLNQITALLIKANDSF